MTRSRGNGVVGLSECSWTEFVECSTGHFCRSSHIFHAGLQPGVYASVWWGTLAADDLAMLNSQTRAFAKLKRFVVIWDASELTGFAPALFDSFLQGLRRFRAATAGRLEASYNIAPLDSEVRALLVGAKEVSNVEFRQISVPSIAAGCKAAGVSVSLRREFTRLSRWARGSGRGGLLTARQLEIARLAAQGMSDLNIANRLNIAESTVGTHLMHAFRRLGVSSRVELANQLRGA